MVGSGARSHRAGLPPSPSPSPVTASASRSERAQPACAMVERRQASVRSRIPTAVTSLCVLWRFRCDVRAVGERPITIGCESGKTVNGERCDVSRCVSINALRSIHSFDAFDRRTRDLLFDVPAGHAGCAEQAPSIPCRHCKHDCDLLIARASASSTYRLMRHIFAPTIALPAHEKLRVDASIAHAQSLLRDWIDRLYRAPILFENPSLLSWPSGIAFRAHARTRQRSRHREDRMSSIVSAVLDRASISRSESVRDLRRTGRQSDLQTAMPVIPRRFNGAVFNSRMAGQAALPAILRARRDSEQTFRSPSKISACAPARRHRWRAPAVPGDSDRSTSRYCAAAGVRGRSRRCVRRR